MKVKVERLTEECQERSDQANEWYKALQVYICNLCGGGWGHSPAYYRTLKKCVAMHSLCTVILIVTC